MRAQCLDEYMDKLSVNEVFTSPAFEIRLV